MKVYIHVIVSAIFSNNIVGNLTKYFVLVAHGVIKCYRQKDNRVEVRHVRKSSRTQIPPFFYNDPYILNYKRNPSVIFGAIMTENIFYTILFSNQLCIK